VSQYVLDAHAVSERYWINIDAVDPGYWLHEEISANLQKEEFKITEKQKKEYTDKSVGWTVRKNPMMYCYLLSESEHWTERVIRTINFEDPENWRFTKGPSRIMKIKQADGLITRDTVFHYTDYGLKTLVAKGLRKGHVTPYKTINFIYDKDSTLLDTLDHYEGQWSKIRLKEDWYYDRKSGELKNKIIGMGLVAVRADGSEHEFMWLYYPEVKYVIQHVYLNDWIKPKGTWQEILTEQNFEQESVRSDNPRDRSMSTLKNFYETDYNEHRTDLDAHWELQKIKEYIQYNNKGITGPLGEAVGNGYQLKGILKNGFLDGEVTLQGKDGKTLLTVDYVLGTPHGTYQSYWGNGQLKEEGQFNHGLKQGVWKGYFKSGKKLALKNYLNGWMDGKQQTWYENGKEQLHYSYVDWKLNGAFSHFNENGSVRRKGFFKNDVMHGDWEINYPLTKLQKALVLNNAGMKWGFDPKAAKDGVLSYSVKLVHKTIPYCAIDICVSAEEFSEFK